MSQFRAQHFRIPNHKLSEEAEKMLIDYEVFAISRFKDNTQKPYYMDQQLGDVKVDTYLLEGDKDLLFPFQKSIDNAQKRIKTLKDCPKTTTSTNRWKPSLCKFTSSRGTLVSLIKRLDKI